MPNLPPEAVRVVAEVRARQWDRLYGPLIGPRTRFEDEAREILEAVAPLLADAEAAAECVKTVTDLGWSATVQAVEKT